MQRAKSELPALAIATARRETKRSSRGFRRPVKTLVLPLLALITSAAFADDIGLRMRVGLNDTEATAWDGTVTVAPGRVALIGGWRFAQDDKVDGTTGWKARTRPAVLDKRSNNPGKAGAKRAQAAAASGVALGDNGVLFTFADVTEESQVTIKTAKGEFAFKLADVPFGKTVDQLAGAVELQRTAAAFPLTSDRADDDYPSAAVAADGTAWITYASYTPGLDRDERAKSFDKEPEDLQFLARAPGGDQLWLRSVRGHEAGEAMAITATGRDIYKSAVAVDGTGRVWVAWAENQAYKPFPDNPAPGFDIWVRSFKDGKLGEPVKLSDSKESDVWPVAATDSKGRVWVAWQGARDRVFRIFARHQDGEGWSRAEQVSTQTRNCWAPAITAAKDGRVAIAWDTYEKGDYDVWLREFTDGKAAEARPVANSADYEARPAMSYDHEGALWVSWEKSGPTWGKDFGAYATSGIGLYRDRQIGLAVLKNGQWMEPAGDFTKTLPGAVKGRRQNNVRVPTIEPNAETRKAGEEAEFKKDNAHNNIARIVCDSTGRVWLFARARQNDMRTPLGSLWFNWATYLDGNQWVGPILVPHSDNLLYNTPAVVALKDGGLLVAHSSDHRQDRHIQRKAGAGNIALDADKDPFDNDLFLSRLSQPGAAKPAQLVASKHAPEAQPAPSPATTAEREAIARCRDFRAKIDGKELRILRGEFHRHTEISGDGGNDGPLEDMWRYAIDVAAMDWLGCGDHDNGAGREYPWWLTQKTTDAFFLPGAFDPMFTYERSVRYPEGHRNVVFARRGIRTLPRLPISTREPEIHAPDTQMLYKYLHLFDGVCASHTSATSMGTDWRDNDPAVEPMVEIYQGCRQNYERPGAPRCPTQEDSIGGWEPKGMVNLALLKGYKFSFESSSDHGSTHISYAMVLAEDHSREAVVAAMKKRHTYAATANIVADFRCTAGGKEHIMGDDFTTSEAPKLTCKLLGTAPFAKVTIVKDDVEVETLTPNTAKVDLTWTDPNPTPGKTSYYYIRGEQSDAEKQLVWVSPMWIKFQPQ